MLLRLLRPSLIVLLAAGAYLNTLQNQFVYDDGAQILRNHYIRDIRHIPDIVSTNVWSFMGPHAVSNYYRPVQHLVYMADYALFGYEPAGYHATNVVFHSLNALLVLALGQALGLGALVAFGGAALFAVHPIGTEAVAWVAGIPELAYTFFFLVSLLAYVQARPVDGERARHPRAWLAVSIGSGLLAMFSKETALVLPLAVAAYEHLFRQSIEGHRRRIWWHAGLWVVLVLYLAARIASLGGFQVATNPYGVMPFGQFVLSSIYLVGKYVWKLAAPAPLNIFHVFRPAEGITDWRVLAGLLVLAALAAATWAFWGRRRMLIFAMVVMLLPLVPALNVRAIGHNVFTERYLYLPIAGFAWLVAAALAELRDRRVAIGMLVLLVANYGLLTHYRNRDWHDDVMLYTVTLQVSPESNLIRDNLGKTFLDGYGRPDLAVQEFRECIRRAPERAEYYYGLGQAYAELRRYDDALAALQTALDRWLDYPEVYLALGDVYREMGDNRAAAVEYARALKLKPTYAEALVAAGALDRAHGRSAQAEAWFRQALKVTDIADAHLHLGLLYLDQSRYAEAEREFRAALVTERHSVVAWQGLGRALKGLGRREEAAECFRTALNERAYATPRRFGRLPLPDAVAIRRDLDETSRPVNKALSQRGSALQVSDKADQNV